MLVLGLNDPHFEVVRAAVSGLGHRPHADALQVLVTLSKHQSARMRRDVAVTLAGYSEPAAVEALLQLASDEESEVRDWATFGLGTQSDADNSDIRAMLWKNAHDVDSDVSGEALVGLARRQDPRAVDLLKPRLTEECRVYEFDAAQALKDPVLAGPLRALCEAVDRETGIDPFWHAQLLAALEACSGGPSTG
jgi:HEAT repeat protein